jgi:hypothetical protein
MRQEIKNALEYLISQEKFKGMLIQFTSTGFRVLADSVSTADVSAVIDELRISNSQQIAENQRIYKSEEPFKSFDDRKLVHKEVEKKAEIKAELDELNQSINAQQTVIDRLLENNRAKDEYIQTLQRTLEASKEVEQVPLTNEEYHKINEEIVNGDETKTDQEIQDLIHDKNEGLE